MHFRSILLCLFLPLIGRPAELPLGSVLLEGELPFSEKKALEVLDLETGRPFHPGEAQAASNRLMEALRSAYHPLARVRWSAASTADGSGLSARFVVEAGPKGKLREVNFTGNNSLSDTQLISVLKTVPRSGRWARLTGRDVLLTETLGADQQALADRYQTEGFMDVRIGVPDLVHVGGEQGFHITWPIEEGPQYRTGIITVNGEPNAPLTRRHSGSLASPGGIQEIGRRIRSSLDREGFAFAQVEMVPDWQSEVGQLDLNFVVKTGPVSRLRKLRVAGNTRTGPRIILRETAWVPGDRYHGDQMDNFSRRLMRTGLFDEVDLSIEPMTDGQEFDLVVEVEEAHTGRVEGGVTWGEVEGLAFVTTLRERNFALRPPFRGQALELDLGLTLGSEIIRLEGGIRNPRLADSFWVLSTRVFHEDNDFISDRYNQRNQGASLLLLHPVGGHHLLGGGWSYSLYTLTDIDPVLDAELSDADRKVDLSGPRAVWMFDAVDRAFRPGKGGRMRQEVLYGLSGLRGNTEVVEWKARGELFFPLWRDAVLRIHGETRHVVPVGDTTAVPLSLRAFLGGADTLKAFEYSSVSPFDENGAARGGEAVWWGGPELLLPVASRLDLALYTHAGDVSDSAGSFSGEGPVAEWGLGFLIRAENFPVRFDVAFPLRVLENDPVHEEGEARFTFSAAYTF